jgi:predicted RNase H-like nuclease (RuvC/YqgF family)
MTDIVQKMQAAVVNDPYYAEAIAEIERLGKQCEGLAQSALNNGQDLLLHERKVEQQQQEIERLTKNFIEAAERSAKAEAEVERLTDELAKAHRLLSQSIGWQRDAEIVKAKQQQEIERLRAENTRMKEILVYARKSASAAVMFVDKATGPCTIECFKKNALARIACLCERASSGGTITGSITGRKGTIMDIDSDVAN